MNLETLRNELHRAEEAELQSDEQLRQLVEFIDKAATPTGQVDATNCAKLVSAALSLNVQLRDRSAKLRERVHRAEIAAEGLTTAERMRRASKA